MGLRSTQSGATPFRPPTQPNQAPRSQLTSVCRGPPGPVIPHSLRFFMRARSQRPTSSQAAPQFVPGPRPYLEIAPHCHSLARGFASSPILPGGLTRGLS
ncbi:hypothetical protein NDU88_006428 [Pleurodeles waltl]|uniref:Uncharacterized protein n=1 Tax=Pleurodeles waltl TaxID=8319 RepID=A0AAV7SPL3_PLEWA|nr:hypothetical protein NDU88_006428 [Pleurodeles waltl]